MKKSAPNVAWDRRSVVVGDLACDGNRDLAFMGRADGKVFVGLYRAQTKKAQVLEFSVNAGRQDAICSEPAELAAEPLDYDLDSEAQGFEKSSTCKGLILDDHACDPIHFFWDHVTHELNWWRN